MSEGFPGRWVAACLLAAAALAGLLLRAAGGVALFPAALVYAVPRRQAPPGSASPEDAVRSFYLLLDQGRYAEAWSLAREPDYTGTGNALYRSEVAAGPRPGWTSRNAFVARLRDELGSGGEWLRLTEVQAEVLGDAEARDLLAAGGAQTPPGAVVVRARGTLLGACTIFSWQKTLPVSREGGRYRLLLPGTKPADSLFYQEWFADLRRIGTLRAAAP